MLLGLGKLPASAELLEGSRRREPGCGKQDGRGWGWGGRTPDVLKNKRENGMQLCYL